MNKRPKTESSVSIGIASLLVIFTILCLVTLAVMTLSSSASGLESAERTAERRQSYYAAVSSAEVICHDIDQMLAHASASEETAGAAASNPPVSPASQEAESSEKLFADLLSYSRDGITLNIRPASAETSTNADTPNDADTLDDADTPDDAGTLDDADLTDPASSLVCSIDFKVPETDERMLCVRLDVFEIKGAYYYEIRQWQIIDGSDWEGDESPNLITFDF